jgi:uncharacterized protein YoxC
MMDRLLAKMETLQDDVVDVKIEVVNVKNEVTNLSEKMDALSEKVDRHEEALDAVKKTKTIIEFLKESWPVVIAIGLTLWALLGALGQAGLLIPLLKIVGIIA